MKKWTFKIHIIASIIIALAIGGILYLIIQPKGFETITTISELQNTNLSNPYNIQIGSNYILVVIVLMLILNLSLYKSVKNIIIKTYN